MQIVTNGHEELYMLQNIALCFFPATHFSEDTKDDLFLTSTLQDGLAVSVLTVKGNVFTRSERVQNAEDMDTAVARSFYGAAQEATGSTPPWGTLTGIRPSKKVKSVMERSPGNIEEVMERIFYTKPPKTALALSVMEGEEAALAKLSKRAVSVYVGIPFCPSRCSYCSFVSHTIKEAAQQLPAYLEMLKREMDMAFTMLARLGIPIQTLYIGGGTPTTLSEEQLLDLMTTVKAYVPVDTLAEYTVEAGRADTITVEKLRIIREQGAGRISVNAQTTCDATLRAIGRTHTAADFFEKFAAAKAVGFDSINVDLIAGLPGETSDLFEQSLNHVVDLDPENITIHTLSLKRAAVLAYEDMQKSREDLEGLTRMLGYSAQNMAENGYSPYYLYRQRNTLGNLENVGYGKKGKECLYNVYTMGEYQSILALGGGGVSKVVDLPMGRIQRTFNYKHFYDYSKDFSKAKENLEIIEGLLQERPVYSQSI